jgi:hypothetical protein
MEDVVMYSEDSPNSENPATDKNATRKKRNPDNAPSLTPELSRSLSCLRNFNFPQGKKQNL